MPRKLLIFIAAAFLSGALQAADPVNTGEARLREALRNTMLQLRDAEAQTAALQAAQTESDQQKKALAAQVEALIKQAAADRQASEKTIGGLDARVADNGQEIARLKESLEKWKASCNLATDAARGKEAERAKLAAENIVLQRRVADQQTRNAALFKLGGEILTRYEKFGLGEALLAREPFTGITRVKLETLVQDYQDKLTDQKIKP